VFRQGLKNKANMLVAEIEKADRSVLRIDEQTQSKIFNEQIELAEQSFRKWIEETINV
jgi:hypothetical protein